MTVMDAEVTEAGGCCSLCGHPCAGPCALLHCSGTPCDGPVACSSPSISNSMWPAPAQLSACGMAAHHVRGSCTLACDLA